MSHILVAFAHDPTDWISCVMAWATRGKKTHCALIHPHGLLAIEASSVGKPKGVRYVLTERLLMKPGAVVRRIPHPDPMAVWYAAEEQIGKKYDWRYIWGWVFHNKWEHPDRWVCHELIAWACKKAGHEIIGMDEPHWLTPQHLFLISQPLD